MTNEELIARLREPWFTNGCERYQRDAADRIEALTAKLAKAVEALEESVREFDCPIARTTLAEIKGDTP